MTKPVRYLQTDPRWADHNYSVGSDVSTLGVSGCGPTVMAMVISTLTDTTVTPPDLADWAMDNGYRRLYQGTDFSFFQGLADNYNLEIRSEVSFDEALSAIHDDHLVICQMSPGNWSIYGDYILWYHEENGTAYIMDPQSETRHRSITTINLLILQAKRYWIVKNPCPRKQGVENTNAEMMTVLFDVNGNERYYPAVKVNGSIYVGVKQLLDNLGFTLNSGDGKLIIRTKEEQGT